MLLRWYSYYYIHIWFLVCYTCVAGTRLRIQPEVQGGQVHNRNGTHDQRKRLGESAEEINYILPSVCLSVSLSLSFPPRVSLVRSLCFPYPTPTGLMKNSLSLSLSFLFFFSFLSSLKNPGREWKFCKRCPDSGGTRIRSTYK